MVKEPLSFNLCRGVAARAGSVHFICSMDWKAARTHPHPAFSKKFDRSPREDNANSTAQPGHDVNGIPHHNHTWMEQSQSTTLHTFIDWTQAWQSQRSRGHHHPTYTTPAKHSSSLHTYGRHAHRTDKRSIRNVCSNVIQCIYSLIWKIARCRCRSAIPISQELYVLERNGDFSAYYCASNLRSTYRITHHSSDFYVRDPDYL